MHSTKSTVALFVAAVIAGQLSGTGQVTAQTPAPAPKPAPASADSSSDKVLEEIVIAVDRYEATDLQIDASNSVSVLSAEDLSDTAVHNVAEALGLLAGVNVLNIASGAFIGGVDGASRAEGRYVSLRGMNGEYNVNLINGIEVAQGSPYSRQVQLSLLPPSGLKTIVLNKTSRADMDGTAIGGTVDFRTPTAFEFKEPQASLTLGGRFESRAYDYGKNKDGLGYNVAGDIARRFGEEENFGVYASTYYDIRNYANSEMGGVMEAGCCDNGWSLARFNADGSNPAGVDPEQNLQLNAMNVGVSSGYTERMGGNLSLDWKFDDTATAYFRATYAYANTRQDSHLTQIVGMDVAKDAASGAIPDGTSGLYRPNIGGVSIRYWYETNPEHADLGTAQLGVDKKIGAWTLSPNAFVSWGRNDRPNHIEISARTAAVMGGGITDNGFPYDQSTLFTYKNGFAYPQLTPAMAAQLNDLLSLPANDRGELQKAYSDQTKVGARLDTQYDIDAGTLQYLKFGGKYMHSSRSISFNDWTNQYHYGGTFGSLPIWDGSYSPVFPGKYSWSAPRPDQNALFNYFNSGLTPNSLDTCGSIAINNINCNTQEATEAVSSIYAMAEFRAGDWEFIPGVRYEHTDVDNTFWVTPFDAGGNQLEGHFGNNSTSFSEVLPSAFVNYRPSAKSVYRAGIWRSYTRPPFGQLGGGARVEVDSSSGTTTVTQGNPDLKAVTSTNFDLSGEWDTARGGHFMVGAFYKALQDYINDTGSTRVSLDASGGGTITNQPTNGGSGKAYGFELAGRQLFRFLPAPFDALGVSGTLTREYTSVDLGDPALGSNERITNAPDWLANVELFYEKGGAQVGLIYNYSGAYLAQYDFLSQHAAWDDLWVRARRRLDLHAGYDFQSGLKVDLSVSNLLKDYTYWSHIGRTSLVDSDIVDSGLTALLNATYKF
jgi:TonB-dependent receptor